VQSRAGTGAGAAAALSASARRGPPPSPIVLRPAGVSTGPLLASARHVEPDPLGALRATAVAAAARNVLGVIPATRPQQQLTLGGGATTTSTMRASGRFDRGLEATPAVERPGAALPVGARTAAAASVAAAAGSARVAATAARAVARERASEAAEVAALR
jgi:hypothetical protein